MKTALKPFLIDVFFTDVCKHRGRYDTHAHDITVYDSETCRVLSSGDN